MKTKAFAIYDSKAEAYNSPFFMQTKGLALRAFADEANNPQSNIHKHAGDYSLFELGEYDDQTGVIMPHETRINLGTALEHKKDPIKQLN